MSTNNIKFDVIEFFVLSIKDGIKPNILDIERLSQELICEFNHKVSIEFWGNDLIKKVLYIRQFKCDSCKKICNDIMDTVCNWVSDGIEMSISSSFIEKGT